MPASKIHSDNAKITKKKKKINPESHWWKDFMALCTQSDYSPHLMIHHQPTMYTLAPCWHRNSFRRLHMQTHTCTLRTWLLSPLSRLLHWVGLCDWVVGADGRRHECKSVRGVLGLRLQPITVSLLGTCLMEAVDPPHPPPPSSSLCSSLLWVPHAPLRSIWWWPHSRHLAPRGRAPVLPSEPPGTPCLGDQLRSCPTITMKNWETLIRSDMSDERWWMLCTSCRRVFFYAFYRFKLKWFIVCLYEEFGYIVVKEVCWGCITTKSAICTLLLFLITLPVFCTAFFTVPLIVPFQSFYLSYCMCSFLLSWVF